MRGGVWSIMGGGGVGMAGGGGGGDALFDNAHVKL